MIKNKPNRFSMRSQHNPAGEAWGSRASAMRDWNTEETAFHPSGEDTHGPGNGPPGSGPGPVTGLLDCPHHARYCREHRGRNERKNAHVSHSHAAYNLEGKTDMSVNKWKISSSEVITTVTTRKAGHSHWLRAHRVPSTRLIFLTWWSDPVSPSPSLMRMMMYS